MRDSNTSVQLGGQCSHFSPVRVCPGSTRWLGQRIECGTRKSTDPVFSRTYLSLNSTHPATAPVAQWWSDSLVSQSEKAVGPGFNPRPGLQQLCAHSFCEPLNSSFGPRSSQQRENRCDED